MMWPSRLGLLATLATTIPAERVEMPAPLPPPIPDAVAAVMPTAPAAATGTAHAIAVTLARPLFEPDRRAPTQALPSPTLDVLELPHLSGTVIQGGRRVAMIVLPGGQRPIAVREGERVGRFLVVRIAPGEVTADGPRGLVALHVGFLRAVDPKLPAAPAPPDPRLHGPNDQDE